MNMAAHIESLRLKHSHLEDLIFEENKRPHPDDILLHELKTKKLKVKEEITRCRKQ